MAMSVARYLIASLALGLVACWMSENFFWTQPPEAIQAGELLLTWLAYSLCCATALSAVMMTGIRGLTGVFLAGALLGWSLEGVIVGEAYKVFPYQLVWTPLAWHALITAVIGLAVLRAAARWSVARQVTFLLALGIFGAAWAWYWPSERPMAMPSGEMAFYLAGLGLAVPVANITLDRIARLAPLPVAVHLVAPTLLGINWILVTHATGNVLAPVIPLLMILTFWIMRRLGTPDRAIAFGAPAPIWRHALFLITPALTTILAFAGWSSFGHVPSNIPIALFTGGVGLGWWLWSLAKAIRQTVFSKRAPL